MARLLLTLLLAAGVAVTARSQDLHLSESGSAAVLSHSAFAHGYRHGYEEGYHVGNADVSLGSSQRRKIKEFPRPENWAIPHNLVHATYLNAALRPV